MESERRHFGGFSQLPPLIRSPCTAIQQRWTSQQWHPSELRVELFGEMGKLRAEMHDLRANLIQWMFLFWIGQIGVLTGILFAFFRK